MHDPIAYTYEADYHCPGCAIERFGASTNGRWPTEDAEDSEGNPVGAVFTWDEWYNVGEGTQTLWCSACGDELDIYTEDEEEDE